MRAVYPYILLLIATVYMIITFGSFIKIQGNVWRVDKETIRVPHPGVAASVVRGGGKASVGDGNPRHETVKQQREVSFFPEYGTPEFSETCEWAASPPTQRNCTFLVRPDPRDGEGVSLWVALITQAHQLAQQAQCNLIFDYGEGIDVTSVLTPISSNWTVSQGFTCRKHCYHWKSPHRSPRVSIETITEQLNKSIAVVPLYRYAYNLNRPNLRLYKDDFEGIARNIPSFSPETGMACSLGSLFRLSSDASQYVPDLFTRILPTLHSEDSLVISLYIRTKQADKAADKKKNKEPNPFVEETDYRDQSKNIIHCALKQEQEHLQRNNNNSTRIVWMVVTDSKELKQWIAQMYTTREREVVITSSRGAHSRSDGDPSTADFAEALIDWFLIGESAFLVMDKSAVSFGGTAALRTARPVYDASSRKCSKAIPIHEGRNKHNAL